MGMIEWARDQVAIAKIKNNDDAYICACLDSALRAYETLLSDGHSGLSFHITAGYLKSLIDEVPLTDVLDEDDQWDDTVWPTPDRKCYRHKYMLGLYKNVYPDGHVTYDDVNRFRCSDTFGGCTLFHNGFVDRICNQYIPITFPYIRKRYKVYVTQFLVNPKNGDYDTMRICGIFDENDTEVKHIDRYFKEGDKTFVEIDLDEYCDRWDHHLVKEANADED